MKNYKIIQKEQWSRKEHFDFFSGDGGSPLYDITTYLDVTNLYNYVKIHNIYFYYSLIWVTTHIMNQLADFRYKIRGENIILHHRLIPAFTDLKAGSELFHIVVLDFQGNMAEFAQEAEKTSNKQKNYFPPSLNLYEEDMLIQFSCIPWISFTSLNIEKSNDPDDSVPKITWGKYESIGKNIRLPYSIQVNHRLIDGVHLGTFFTQLQSYIDSLSSENEMPFSKGQL